MLTHSNSFWRFAGVLCFALLGHVLERGSVLVASSADFSGEFGVKDGVIDMSVLLLVFAEECDADEVKERALRSTVKQSPAPLRSAEPRQEHDTRSTTEVLEISARQVASYEAYTRTLFTLTFQDGEASQIAEERFPMSCTVSDEMLHKVGVNILSLFDCPRLRHTVLKRAFDEEPCVQSVEFSREVQIAGGLPQEAGSRRPGLSVHVLPKASPAAFPSSLQRTSVLPRPSITTYSPSDRHQWSSDSYSASPTSYSDRLSEPLKHSGVSQPLLLLAPPANLESHSSQYWRNIAGFSQGTNFFPCDASVVVAVVDTGIARNHPRLRNNVWMNTGEIPGNNVDDDLNGFVDDVHGFNFIHDTGNTEDDNGHGTHCAGIIGGQRDESTDTQGVCERVSIASLKFLNAYGRGSTANAVKALNYALHMKFPVSSHSWGGPGYSPALAFAVSKANEAGHLVIAAAGNDGADLDAQPFYPASLRLPNVIAVAASDMRDRIASFSNTGVSTVHVAAPGVNLLSTFPPDTFKASSGTSVATAVVSGLAALLRAVPNIEDPALIKEAILRGVDKLPTATGRLITGGRINAAKSVLWLWNCGNNSANKQIRRNREEDSPVLAVE